MLSFLISAPTLAINFGYYKAETDYGLIDGFKWNFFNREKGEPLVQLKSETEEEKIRIEKEKNKAKDKLAIYEEAIQYLSTYNNEWSIKNGVIEFKDISYKTEYETIMNKLKEVE